MIDAWRDIAVFLDGTAQGERIAAHAAALAKRHGAHLVGVYGIAHPHALKTADSFARGAKAVAEVIERQRSSDEAKVVEAGRAFAATIRTFGISSEYRIVWRENQDDDAALRTLHADAIVTARPKPADLPPSWTAEHILLTAGLPVLLIPDGWEGAVGGNVLVAWNGSREARRAINDAMPVLAEAGAVSIMTLAHPGDAEPQTDDLLRHLAHHGVTAVVRNVERVSGSVSEALMEQARQLNVDLLVIGAYSRPRRAELLFGGTTRDLLAHCPTPLFLSR